MTRSLPLIPEFAERFIQNWSDKRHTSSTDETSTNRHNIYILPTKNGLIYFFVLILILFGSINYENNLGYILAFFLGSLSLLGMVHTHQNINQLNIKIGQADAVFSGQSIYFPLYISQSDTKTRPSLNIISDSGEVTQTQLINTTNTLCQLKLLSSKRGYVSPKRIKLYSEFPLGLFHAWSWLKLDSRCLVYPKPATPQYAYQTSQHKGTGQSKTRTQGVDDFAGIREYQAGDLANHMAWKAIAKTGELQTKHYHGETTQTIYIDWAQTSEALDIETRLSILCRMILDAEEKNMAYGFKIPGQELPPSSGLKHKHQCLKSLALFMSQ